MPNYLERKIDRVQSVVKFFEDPCQAPWSVYFELSLPALGHVVLELLTFGLDDVIRGYFRPKGIYRRGRTGILARKFGKWAGIPEIGEMIGAHLPGSETIRGRSVAKGVRFMWLVDGALQRLMFWWMIVDLLSDFLYEWTSAINKTVYCRSRCTGAVVCPVFPNTLITSQWVYLGPDLLNCEKQWGTVSTAGGSLPVYTTGGWTACEIVVIPFIGVCAGAEIRIIDADNNVLDQVPVTENPNGTFSALTAAQIPPHKLTYVQGRAIGSTPPCYGVLVTGGTISGWAYT